MTFFPSLVSSVYVFRGFLRIPCTWLVLGIGQAAGHNRKFFGSRATKAFTSGLELQAGNGLGRNFDLAEGCARLARQFFWLPVQIPTGHNLKPR
jgi:hypothetical protein